MTRNDIDPTRIEEWRQAIRSTTFANYRYHMGVALERTGETAVAIANYEAALQHDASNAAARSRLIELLRRAGEVAKVDALVTEGSRIDPYFQAAAAMDIAMEDLDCGKARSVFDRVLGISDLEQVRPALRAEALRQIGRALRANGDGKGAVHALGLAHTTDPGDMVIIEDLAEAQVAANDLDGLERSVAIWLAGKPGDPAALFMQGRLLIARARYEEADEAVRDAYAAGHPNRALVGSFRIRLMLIRNDPAGALTYYEAADEAVRRDWNASAYAMLARIHLGAMSDMLPVMDRIIDQSNSPSLAKTIKCILLSKLGSTAGWKGLLKSILDDRPSNFSLLVGAILHGKEREWDRAVNLYKAALEMKNAYFDFYVGILPDGRKTLVEIESVSSRSE